MNGSVHSDLHGLIVFRLGGLDLALPVEAVREVVPVARLARPLEMPKAVEGILDLAGSAVLVLRLDRLLGLDDCRYCVDSSILILRGPPPLGLLVEHVEAVRPAADFQILPVAAEASFNGCVTAQLASGRAPLHLLSPARLLLEEERARLADFAARAQARRSATAEPAP